MPSKKLFILSFLTFNLFHLVAQNTELVNILEQADQLDLLEKHTQEKNLLSKYLNGNYSLEEQSKIYWRLSRAISEETNLKKKELKHNNELNEEIKKSFIKTYLEAQGFADKAIESDPENANGYFYKAANIGYRALLQGLHNSLSEFEKIKKYLEQTVRLDNKHVLAIFSLCKLYTKTPGFPISFGNPDYAVSLGRKALFLHEQNLLSHIETKERHYIYQYLAEALAERNWGIDKREAEYKEKQQIYDSLQDPYEKLFYYEGVTILNKISDIEEAKILLNKIINIIQTKPNPTKNQQLSLITIKEVLTEIEQYSSPNQKQPFLIKFKPKPIGANLIFGYKDLPFIRGLDTILWAGGGAFWEQTPFYRNFNDELLTADNIGDLDLKQDLLYERLNINWEAGITQGIFWNREINENLLDISLFYKGRYDEHYRDDTAEQVLFNQNHQLPDTYGIQQNAFITGFNLNMIVDDKQKNVKDGFGAEISLEWAPVFINSTADYIRFNTILKNFIKIFSLPVEAENYFSMYWGNMLIFDLIEGASVPINVRQSVGGIQQQRLALGNGVIRGVDKGRYDANLKLAECSELRMILPISLFNEIVPGIMCFFDTAYYDYLKGTNGGFLFSTGGGVFIDLFDKLQLTYYMSCFLNGNNLNGEQWSFFNLAFKLHF